MVLLMFTPEQSFFGATGGVIIFSIVLLYIMHKKYVKQLQVSERHIQLLETLNEAATAFIIAGIARNYMPFYERHSKESLAAQLNFAKLYVTQTFTVLSKMSTPFAVREKYSDTVVVSKTAVLVLKTCLMESGSAFAGLSLDGLHNILTRKAKGEVKNERT